MGRPLPSRPLSARPTGPSAWVRPGLEDDSNPGIQRPVSARNSRFPNGGAFTAIERKKLHTQELQRLQNDPEFEHHEHAITPNAFPGASRFRQLLPPSSRPVSTCDERRGRRGGHLLEPGPGASVGAMAGPPRGPRAFTSALAATLDESLGPEGRDDDDAIRFRRLALSFAPKILSHWGPKGGRPVRRPAGLSLTTSYPNNVQARHKLFVGVASEGVRAMHMDRTTETREAYGPKRLSPRPLPRPRPGAVMGAPVWYGIQKSDLCW